MNLSPYRGFFLSVLESVSRILVIRFYFPVLCGRFCLARGLRSARVSIFQGIVPLSQDGPHAFLSINDNPQFITHCKFSTITKGWYLLEIRILFEKRADVARLYIDYKDGSSEEVSLPFSSGGVHKRLVLFRRGVRKLRFSPITSEGKFTVSHLVLYPRLQPFVKEVMLNRLVGRESKSVEQANRRNTIWRSAEVKSSVNGLSASNYLYKMYSESFNYSGDGGVDYARWQDEVEPSTYPSCDEVELFINEITRPPVFSIITPVYNTPEHFLTACIESVIAQSYPYWEMCLVDDASSAPHVLKVIEGFACRDARIRLVRRKYNGHISAASNSALEVASGDFIALLDHDDMFAKHALYFMAKQIVLMPGLKVIYSDEDKIDSEGGRFEPHFKSDWNPDLFFSQNYVSHLGVFSHSLVAKVGGFCEGVEGSQDKDLLLRCLPYICDSEIFHIPLILYHWRSVKGSTAFSSTEKGYASKAAIKSLQNYFASNGFANVNVSSGVVPNSCRVSWDIPDPQPLVSLLVPTKDEPDLIRSCVLSILDRTAYKNYEVLILDNGTTDVEALEFFDFIQRSDSRVRVLRYDHEFNYSSINNFGVSKAYGDVIGLINNDIEVISPDWLTEMLGHAIRPEIGCVGAKLFYKDGTIQHAGVILGIGGVAGHSHKYFSGNSSGYFSRLQLTQNVSAVTGACLLVRRDIYECVGGLNEEYLKIAFNDVDFCLKVSEAGYRNIWTPYAELYHLESKSRGEEDTPAKKARFQQEVTYMRARWGSKLYSDPYYNRNLSRMRQDFSIDLIVPDSKQYVQGSSS